MSNETAAELPDHADVGVITGRGFIPGWVISAVVHLALFFVFAAVMRGCTRPVGLSANTEYREVGIYMPDSGDERPEQQQSDADTPPDDSAAEDQSDAPDPSKALQSNAPPVPLSVPESPEQLIGSGGPPLPTASSAAPDPRRIKGSAQPLGAGLGRGETSFMDIRDSGNRFVYLIDCSGSMYGYPMQYATAQLKASLQNLDRTQQFQIILYNTTRRRMSLRSKPNQDLYWATSLNLADAARFVESAMPDHGTFHVDALLDALRLGPEVVFFLTDGSEPAVAVGELERIRKANRSAARIHCIEFAKGPPLRGNWVKRLAAENGGTYRHINIRRR